MKEEFLEWAKIHFKNIDVLKKEIKEIKEIDKNSFEITKNIKNLKSKEIIFIIGKNQDIKINQINNQLIQQYNKVYFIIDNSKKQIEFILNNWQDLSKSIKTNILFTNIKKGSRWKLNPHNHSKITEPEKLQKGLKSLFSFNS